MGNFNITETFIYRWRYPIGYGLVALGLIAVMIFAGLYLPGGISNQEIQSVIKSNVTNFSDPWTIDVVNLPYHLLQHISIALLGVSVISIKLPSIILAFLSAIGMVLLLTQWFKPSIGVLASLIAITTGQFLFIAQNGTSDVLYVFWPVWIILIASLIPIQQKFRKLFVAAFFVTAALSLYTPLSIYVILIIAGAIILHPHLRYLLKQLSRTELIVGLTMVLMLVSPLIYSIFKSPHLILTLLGFPAAWPNLGSNLSSLGDQYLNFINPGGTTVLTPFFELGSVLLIALGAYFVIQTRATAKSYVVILWTLCLIPVVIFNPSLTNITFLPLVLLLGSGLGGLLAHWYELFPRNPYARVGGLVPIIILVTALVFSGVDRYIYEYRYSPNIVPSFSKDLQLIPAGTKNIVVASNELEFYQVIAKYRKQLTISTYPAGDTFLATHGVSHPVKGYKIDQIITSSAKNNSDRFYVYKKLTE